jgi:hypothetical protein
MSYIKGRNFEYRVINILKKYNIKAVRNYLSRKPDLITEIGLFEVKYKLKPTKNKITCYWDNLEDFIKNLKEIKPIRSFCLLSDFPLIDIFPTITYWNKEIIVIIPKEYDTKYLEDFKERLYLMLDAYEAFKNLY